MDHRRLAGRLLVLLLLAGCGEETAPASAGGESAPAAPTAEDRHRRLTDALREALAGGDVEGAREVLRDLDREYGGTGRREGRTLPRRAVAGAVFAKALEEARRRAGGASPEPSRASDALAVAQALVEATEDPAAPAALAGARAWVGLADLEDLPGRLVEHAGPRVVIYADDFALGDTRLLSVARRWAREGEAGRLRVAVVPILRGHVRRGIRRVPAPEEEERRALAVRLEEEGVLGEDGDLGSNEAATLLGLGGQDAAVVVVDARGRVVGRACGVNVDPRELEVVVQRVASR